MDRLIGFFVLFPLIIIAAIVAVLLPEEFQAFSQGLMLVTGVYIYVLSKKVGKKVKNIFKEKFGKKDR